MSSKHETVTQCKRRGRLPQPSKRTWRLPEPAEATVYHVTDSVDHPPSMEGCRVLKIDDQYVALEPGVTPAGYGTSARIGNRVVVVVPRELVHFTAEAAWVRYIERTEGIIDDLRIEIETRVRWLGVALGEHVKVGPSGRSVEAASLACVIGKESPCGHYACPIPGHKNGDSS